MTNLLASRLFKTEKQYVISAKKKQLPFHRVYFCLETVK